MYFLLFGIASVGGLEFDSKIDIVAYVSHRWLQFAVYMLAPVCLSFTSFITLLVSSVSLPWLSQKLRDQLDVHLQVQKRQMPTKSNTFVIS